MNYEKFKNTLFKKGNDINDETLKKLWEIYKEINKYITDKNSIISKVLFIYKEISIDQINNQENLIRCLIEIDKEVYLKCNDEKYLKELLGLNHPNCVLNYMEKKLCNNYIKYLINSNITTADIRKSFVDYYKKSINKELTYDELSFIIDLHTNLRSLYINCQFVSDQIKNVISECFNKHHFDFFQSINWCSGRLESTQFSELIELAYFLDALTKSNSIDKNSIDKYYILGLLKDFNYNLTCDDFNENVIFGREYYEENNGCLLDTAESIENYLNDEKYKFKNSNFIFGILKEGFDRKDNPQIDLIFKQFYNKINKSLQIEKDEIKYLWMIYKAVYEYYSFSNNLVEMLITLYPYLIERPIDMEALDAIMDINHSFESCYPRLFDDKNVEYTKDEFYKLLKKHNIDNDLKQYLYKFINKKTKQKHDDYYSKKNIEKFFRDEFLNIFTLQSTDQIFSDSIAECVLLYYKLPQIDFLKNIPHYLIKGEIFESFVLFSLKNISPTERINLIIGLLYSKNCNSIEQFNNNIYNFYNNVNIDKKYKDKYFSYGILYYADKHYNQISYNNMIKEGRKYYQTITSDEITSDSLEIAVNSDEMNNDISEIAINIDDYWNDLNIKEHNKDFQLGIIYKGIDNYKIKSIEREEVNNQKQLTLNNNFS